jgi:DNA repair protein RecO
LRNDIRASACASYLCDLVQHLTPPETPQESLFKFMEQCLDALCAGEAAVPGRIVHWAELRLMGLLGMAPRLDTCTTCGRAASPGNALYVISVPQGGVVCANCRPGASGPLIPLGLDATAILNAWQSAETPMRARRTACSPEQRAGIERTLGALLAYHLDLPLSRHIALDLMAVRDDGIRH